MEGYKYFEWSNEDLLPLAKEGDEDAYKQLFYNLRPIIVHNAIIYRDRMPIYDMDDFIQEGHILLWKMIEHGQYGSGEFAPYYGGAVRRYFIDIFYEYCKNNMIVLRDKECGDHNVSILAISDYLEKRRARDKELNQIYRIKNAEAIKKRQAKYRKEHHEELCAKKRIWMKEYCSSNREQVNSKKREYWQANKERLNEERRKRRNENKANVYAQNRLYYEKNKERINAKRRAKRNASREAVNAQNRAYYQEHADELKEYQRRYRAAHREEINSKRRKKNCDKNEEKDA